MKPFSIIYAVLIVVVALVSGLGWYGSMVSEYADYGAQSEIESTLLNERAAMMAQRASTNITESGLRTMIQQLPVLGDEGVQVYNGIQTLKNTMLTVADTVDLAADLLTSDFIQLLLPGFEIPQIILDVIKTALILMGAGAVIYFVLNREPD